jgi:hypothetical protein
MREVQSFKKNAFALATQKTYKSQLSSFLQFCLEFKCSPLPVSQSTLLCYTAYLARRLLPTSIPNYLNVIRLLHLESGYPNPLEGNFELCLLKKGINRRLGVPPKQKLPLTVSILRRLHVFLSLDKPSDLAFWAACVIGFLGFMRKSTLLPLNAKVELEKILLRDDISGLDLSSFVLTVRRSKVIQFGQRVHTIPFALSPDSVLCPVRSLLSHFGASPLGGRRPLFNYMEKGREVWFSQSAFVVRLSALLRVAGYKASEYSAHSLRRGGASMAFDLGLSPLQIKMRGDWSSDAFERYVHISSSSAMVVAQSLSAGVVAL